MIRVDLPIEIEITASGRPSAINLSGQRLPVEVLHTWGRVHRVATTTLAGRPAIGDIEQDSHDATTGLLHRLYTATS